jgi:hypothetical protein
LSVLLRELDAGLVVFDFATVVGTSLRFEFVSTAAVEAISTTGIWATSVGFSTLAALPALGILADIGGLATGSVSETFGGWLEGAALVLGVAGSALVVLGWTLGGVGHILGWRWCEFCGNWGRFGYEHFSNGDRFDDGIGR